MFLRDFDVGGPFPPVKEYLDFDLKGQSICSLFAKFLKRKIKTENCWKIFFSLDSREESDGVVSVGVLTILLNPDLEKFSKFSIESQKDYMLDFLYSGLKKALKILEVDLKVLEGIREFVRDNNFTRIYKGKYTRHKWNNKYMARIECEQDFEEARIFLYAKTPNGVTRKQIATSHTSPFCFQIYFGPIKWLDIDNIVLKLADGRKFKVSGFV